METIPDYANHTLDELKAIAYQHMLKQGTYGKEDNGSCRYLVDGNKCGVGLFIPDSLYDPDMECEAVPMEVGVWLQTPLREAFNKLGLASPEKLDFLRKMQKLHDNRANYDVPFDKYLEALERFPTSPD